MRILIRAFRVSLRAIAKLQELDLFDFQDKGFSVRNRNGIAKLRQPDSLNQETDSERLRKGYRKNETTFSEMRQLSQNCDNSLNNETTFSEMRQLSQNCKNQNPEPLPEEDSSSPQTIQTYSDFKKTLSEDKGEKFWDFVREQIKNLPKPVNDLEAWLANKNQAGQNRWEIYYNNFLDAQGKVTENPRENPTQAQKRPSLRDEIEQRRHEVMERLRQQQQAQEKSKQADQPFCER